MATVTKYEVELVPLNPQRAELTRPQIARVILVDGTEVSRGYPDFKEVAAVDPAIISEYNDALRDRFNATAALFDSSTQFTSDLYMQMVVIRTAASEYMANYDQSEDFVSEYL